MNADEPRRTHFAQVLNSRLSAKPMVPRPNVVQYTSTATSSTVSDFVRLRLVADLPQRPRASSLPRVRIERINDLAAMSGARCVSAQSITIS
jgi:hypothetical protein